MSTRLEGREVPMTQTITQRSSQRSAFSPISLTEDLLGGKCMTISDLLEATEKCCGTILARVIDIDTEQGWAYNSCKECLRKVVACGTKFACDNCGKLVTAIPRFKLQVHVIDHTGSTTLILFDRIVSSYLGRTAEDYIGASYHLRNTHHNPLEFQTFVGKQFLFKVEVTDSNIDHGWQTYTVKKLIAANKITL